MRRLYIGLAAATGIVGFSLAAPILTLKILFDDRPAMVIWNVKPVRTLLRPGQAYDFEFDYSKRPECHPPNGRGEVEYRLWTREQQGGFTRFRVVTNSVSFAAPATNAHRITTVPLPVLVPGRYALQSKAVFQCKGASKPLELWTDLWEFDVVEK